MAIGVHSCHAGRMTDTNRKMITRAAAARRAGVSVRTVDRWLASGGLIKYVDGRGRITVDEDEVDRLLTPRPADAAVR
jgi:predicted site-specific integrase-resolvase